MLRLYSGSGSGEITLLEEVAGPTWQRLKRNAVKYLNEAGVPHIAQVLENTPLELWAATNSFNDAFHVLYIRSTVAEYVRLEALAERDLNDYRVIAETITKLGIFIRFVAADVDQSCDAEAVSAPSLRDTSEVVERALMDAEILIKSSGAVSGLDRLHTALHGYVKQICSDAGILPAGKDPDLTRLFKQLREQHPKFRADGARDEDIAMVLNGLSCIVSVLNPIRNRASVAHPNDVLLDPPESHLVVNCVRSLLHYLESKIGTNQR